ncbi:MAG: protein translocase subunit SecF [Roseiflexaceae bacterium]
MEKIVRRRYWWFLISLLIIIPGLVSLSLYGLRPSIDFSGGALWDVYFPDKQSSDLNTEKISQIFAAQGFEGAVVQLSEVTVAGKKLPSALIRTKSLDANTGEAQQRNIRSAMQAEYGTSMQFEQVQSVGATVSQESTRSAVIAVLGACVAILIYLTVAFRKAPHPIRYGVCALVAMLHDVLVVLGIASILGQLLGLEVDALFLTALLTVISFSVHDTIVVFDRIRENLITRRSGEAFEDIVNHSIVQTLPRSINTQLTSMFTLTALLLFGGTSVRNFVAILLIGLVSGTYSSIFNASQLLVVWENHEWTRWFGRREPATA